MNRSIKLISALCSGIICICLILGATYNWFTARDSVQNKFNTANLGTSIYEIYTPQAAWNPDVPVPKGIGVVNNGAGSAIVRVSLCEYLMKLETGDYGHPSVFNLGSMTPADLSNPASWGLTGALAVPAFEYGAAGSVPMKNEQGLLYYKAAGILKSENFSPASGRAPFIEKYIEITWGSGLGTDWYYNPEDSYFYYMKPLPGGSSTSRLTEAVCLTGDYPNSLQFAPYFIEVKHESILAGKQFLTEQWNFSENSYIYQMLAPLMNQ